MKLFNYEDYTAAAKQYGENIFVCYQLQKDADLRRKTGELSMSQWCSERKLLDQMEKEIDKEYEFVNKMMNAIIFTAEHPEGETDKELCRAYLEAAFPDIDPESFAIMQR